MAFDTFPLPDSTPTLEPAIAAIQDQYDVLLGVVGQLADGADAQTRANGAAVKALQDRIKRPAVAAVKRQGEALAELTAPLTQAASERLAQQTAQVALLPATPTAVAIPCPQPPSTWPITWPAVLGQSGGSWWCWQQQISYGFLKAGANPDQAGLSGPFVSAEVALAECPGASVVAQACLSAHDSAVVNGGGAGVDSGSADSPCPPGTVPYDDPSSCFPGGIVPEGWTWNAATRWWVSPFNPTCDPAINAMLPPEHACIHCPVICLPDATGSGGSSGSGGGSGAGTGGTSGASGGSGGTGGSGGSIVGADCPAPVVQCPAPQVTVNVAAPVVNVTCDPFATNGTGPDTSEGTCTTDASGATVCVAGEAFDVANSQRDTLTGPRWGRLDVCATIDKVNVNAQKAVSSIVPEEVLALLKEDTPDFDGFARKWSAGAPIYVRWLVEGLVNVFTHGAHYLLHNGMYSGDCAPIAMALPLIVGAVVDLTEKWLGLGLHDTKVGLNYWNNYVCPTFIPSPGEAHSAFLADTIKKDLWRCWVRANNSWDVPAERIVEAARTRPSVTDVLRLFRRGIMEEPEYLDRMRGNGVLHDRERDLLERVADFVPGPADIIRFMVRDVFDESVVKRYQYDAEFDEKTTGRAAAMAKAAGVSLDDLRMFWRAHWRIPSDSAAFQMLQRLRPGEVDPALVTENADVARLLGINDLAPEWRDRMIAISYRRPTSIQARKGYNLFIIDKVELIAYIQDIGYKYDVALNLARTWEVDRNEFWAKHRWGKAYVSGAYNELQLRAAMTTFAAWNSEMELVRNYLDAIRNAAVREKCMKATRHLFMLGMLTVVGAQQQLIQTNMDPGQAVKLVEGWQCERNAMGRVIPAAKLCHWYQLGLMGTTEFSGRLGALGYTSADALRIVGECDSQARARAQAAATKKAIAAEKAAEKAAAKALKEHVTTEKTIEKNLRRMDKLAAQIAVLIDSTADKVGPDVRGKIEGAAVDIPLSIPEAITVMEGVVAAAKKKGARLWSDLWNEAMADLREASDA